MIPVHVLGLLPRFGPQHGGETIKAGGAAHRRSPDSLDFGTVCPTIPSKNNDIYKSINICEPFDNILRTLSHNVFSKMLLHAKPAGGRARYLQEDRQGRANWGR